MITGALAASYYGRPRTTIDLDAIVKARRNELSRLSRALRTAELKVDEEKIDAAWRSKHRSLNIEDAKSPHTLDIILTDDKLERKTGSVLGLRTFYHRPESLILAKLRMIKATIQAGRAFTDREDIKAILKSTRVRLQDLRDKAKAQKTSHILEDLLREH